MKKLLLGTFLIFCIAVNSYALEDHNNASVETLAKSTISWDGSALPEYPKGTPEITILRIEIPPKCKLPVHRHPVINAGILTKGELTVFTENNEVLHLKAGDSIIEVVEKWHYGINEGTKPAEIIVFYAGVAEKPITVNK